MDVLICSWCRLNVQGATVYLACLQYYYYDISNCSDILEYVDISKGCVLPVRVHCGILQMQS